MGWWKNGEDTSFLSPEEVATFLKERDIARPRCGFDIQRGWLPLVSDLIERIVEMGWDRDLHQVKEKFGGLRFYVGQASDDVRNVISDFEHLSFVTCERCGGQASEVRNTPVGRPRGWLKTLCDDCYGGS